MPLQPDYADAWAWLLAPEWFADANCRSLGLAAQEHARHEARIRWKSFEAKGRLPPDAETGEPLRGILETQETYADHHADSPWFPGRGGGDQTTIALEYCWGTGDAAPYGECKSRLECLRAGLDDPSPISHGVWGGHSVRDRRRIQRLLRAGVSLKDASAKVRAVKIERR